MQKATERIEFRVTPYRKAQIEEAAKREEMSVAQYLCAAHLLWEDRRIMEQIGLIKTKQDDEE